MANKDDKYIADVMAQKKALGIECPKIDSIEIVEIKGYKEETNMDDMSQRMMAFLEQMKVEMDDYYDAIDNSGDSPVEKRYIHRKHGQLNGMCQAFEILTGTRITYSRTGIQLNIKEV